MQTNLRPELRDDKIGYDRLHRQTRVSRNVHRPNPTLRTVVPQDICEALSLVPGDTLAWLLDDDGTLTLKPVYATSDGSRDEERVGRLKAGGVVKGTWDSRYGREMAKRRKQELHGGRDPVADGG